MSERYSKVFALSENLYATGSPIVIEAGALQKDNQTGSVLAQIKMKNISAKVIKAVKVKLTLFDVASNVLTDGVEQQYLDLKVVRDESFGSKSAIRLKESTTRSFAVNIIEVVFEDGSVWSGTANPWETLGEPTTLIDYFNDDELVKQFELKYGSPCHNVLLEEKDLWHCTCGAMNRDNETKCHKCGKSLKALKELDISALKSEKEKRLEAERILAEEKAERERKEAESAKVEFEARKKRFKKIVSIVLPVICILFIGIFSFNYVYNNIFIPNNQYKNAIIFKNEGKYRKAINTFEKLGDYKDSKQQIAECKNLQENQELQEGFDKTQEATILEKKEEIQAALQIQNIGSSVLLGHYEQDGDIQNGSESIEWIVLEKRENRMLLLSKYVLDTNMYQIGCSGWKSSIMQKWLNDSFLNSAFDNIEKSLICMVNNKTSSAGTAANGDSEDRVFLLSIEEVEKYLTKDSRTCQPTSMAVKLGVNTQDNCCIWALRNPGKHEDVLLQENPHRVYEHMDYITYVDITGQIIESGKENSDYCNIRPAIWVSLD